MSIRLSQNNKRLEAGFLANELPKALPQAGIR
jgi:hypothetical protein